MRVSYGNKQGTCTASSNSKSDVYPIYSLGTAVPNTLIRERRNIYEQKPKRKICPYRYSG